MTQDETPTAAGEYVDLWWAQRYALAFRSDGHGRSATSEMWQRASAVLARSGNADTLPNPPDGLPSEEELAAAISRHRVGQRSHGPLAYLDHTCMGDCAADLLDALRKGRR